MSFDSLHFVLFFCIVLFVYWFSPSKYQWMIIMVSSLYFYMSWKPAFVVLILFDAVVSWFFAKQIEKRKTWKWLLVIPLIVCLTILFIFKYLNFGITIINSIFELFSVNRSLDTFNHIILPVGISFYTFQVVGYLIDVYRGEIKAEKHFGKYLAFVMFFPQLVAGPIERASNLLPQIKEKHVFRYSDGTHGLKLMVWGYFKKLVVADTLAIYVDEVYNNLYTHTGFSLLLAALFFSFQIYCDFSGYSDIARGSAQLLGIKLMNNFNCPYFADSIKDFWSRWHISLSTWFRDYVYIPLGGNRKGLPRKCLNISLTFLVSGIWHGSTFMFCIWGMLHALFQIAETLFINKLKIHHYVKHILTLICIAFAWIFFRLNTVHDIPLFFNNLFDKSWYSFEKLLVSFSGITFTTFNNMTPAFLLNVNVFISVLFLFAVSKIEIINEKHISEVIVLEKKMKRYIFDYALIFLIFTTGVFDSTRFIYAAF